MKIKRQKSSKKLWIVSSVVFLIIAGSVAAYALTRTNLVNPDSSDASSSTSSPAVDLSEPTDEQQQAGQVQKEESLNSGQTPTSTSDSLSVTITAANKNDNTLQIRSLISSILGTGTCTLTLTKGNVAVSKTSGIQAGPSNSTCAGFDVPVSELSSGTWAIKIAVTSEGTSGSAQSEVQL